MNSAPREWGVRVEWTPHVPASTKTYHRMSADLRTVAEWTETTCWAEEPRPFIRILCDECGAISKRIRVGRFWWPWSDRVYYESHTGRYRCDGVYIKRTMCSNETAYCPRCYFRVVRHNKMAWDTIETAKFINKFKRELSNVKTQHNRPTSPVSSGHANRGEERANGC